MLYIHNTHVHIIPYICLVFHCPTTRNEGKQPSMTSKLLQDMGMQQYGEPDVSDHLPVCLQYILPHICSPLYICCVLGMLTLQETNSLCGFILNLI